MNLPSDFTARLTRQIGADEAARLCHALNAVAPVSVRLNPAKPLPSACNETDQPWSLAEAMSEAEPVAWCDGGFYLPSRPKFTFDPLLNAGCYYVQEASSMAVAATIAYIYNMYSRRTAADANFRMLDLCAAPGGKSTLWRDMLPADDALLVCNEVVRSRLNILAENMAKWGHPDVVLTGAQPSDFARLRDWFDVIAADVPCSGEGMFRKDSEARSQWSEANVAMCAERQRNIVVDVWPALRTGGLLVYSTCTFNREENEENVQWIARTLGAKVLPLSFPAESGIVESGGGYHFFPHLVRGEGFFVALLQKTTADDGSQAEKPLRTRHHKQPTQAALPAWFDLPFAALPSPTGVYCAVRPRFAHDARKIADTLSTLYCGVPAAEVKGKKYIPQQPLAPCTCFQGNACPRVSLNHTDALRYLRRESLTIPADTPRGYVIACYRDQALGFLNNLGTRANNLYPAQWRKRTGDA